MVRLIVLFILTVLTFPAFAVDIPLAKIDGHSHEMYLVSYKHEKLDQVRDRLLKSMVIDVANLAKLYVVSSDIKQLGIEFDNLQEALHAAVTKLNNELPVDNPIDIMFYFFPKTKAELLDGWIQGKREIQNTTIGTVEVQEVQMSRSAPETLTNGEVVFPLTNQEFEVYSTISNSIDSYNTEMFKKENEDKFGGQPAFLSAIAIQLRLQKDDSAIQIQLLAGLKPGVEEKKQTSKEVIVNQVVVPKGKGPVLNTKGGEEVREQFSTHPMMLASTQVKQSGELQNGIVHLKFGAFAGFNTYGDTEYEGPFALADDLMADTENRRQLSQWSQLAPAIKDDWLKSCQIRQQSAPVIQGRFTNQVTETVVDSLLKGQAIDFNIFAIDLRISKDDKVKAELADIRFSTLSLGCLIMDKVNNQFLQEIEGTIKDKLNRALKIDDLSEQIALSLDGNWNT